MYHYTFLLGEVGELGHTAVSYDLFIIQLDNFSVTDTSYYYVKMYNIIC